MLNTPLAAAVPVRSGDVVYASLQVPDVQRAAAFYAAVLGWSFEPGSEPQGRQVQNAIAPRHGLWGGQDHPTLTLCHAVDDLDAAVARVRAGGGHADEPVQRPYGRIAECVDDQQMVFWLIELPTDQSTQRGPVNGRNQGDISYLTIGCVDTSRFRAFFDELFGWAFSPGHVADAWQISDVAPMSGMYGGEQRPLIRPMYRVGDITAAVTRVRQAGGTATEPVQQPYSQMSECVDDHGTQFYLGQH